VCVERERERERERETCALPKGFEPESFQLKAMVMTKYETSAFSIAGSSAYPLSEKYPTQSCDLSQIIFGLLHSIHAIFFPFGSMRGKA